MTYREPMSTRFVPVVAALVLLAAPAVARAATASASAPPPCGTIQSKYGACDPGRITYEDAVGEANDLTVTSEPGLLVFHDAVPLNAGPGCTQRSDHDVTCPSWGPPLIRAGGGDDRVLVAADMYSQVEGGDGNDRLTGVFVAAGGPGDDQLRAREAGYGWLSGDAGDDVLTGGRATDVLTGGAGTDRLAGGEGDDRLVGDGPGVAPAADVLDGGGGADIASWRDRTAPVVVDLGDPGPDGTPGEGDVLVGVESLAGGKGADTLVGDAGPNLLLGGEGADRLDGGAGDDRLYGERGADRLSGGEGGDRLEGAAYYTGLDGAGDSEFLSDRRSTVNRIDCGPGKDEVGLRNGTDLLHTDCEAIAPYGTRLVAPPPRRIGRHVVAFAIGCPVSDPPHRGCHGTLAVSGAGRQRFRLGRPTGLVTLHARHGNLLARRSLRVRVHFAGRGLTVRFRIVLPA